MSEATPTEIYRQPRSMFVGGFVGSPPVNFLRLVVQRGVVRLGTLLLRPRGGIDAMVAPGVRPEDLAPTEDGFGFRVLRLNQTHVVWMHAATGEALVP